MRYVTAVLICLYFTVMAYAIPPTPPLPPVNVANGVAGLNASGKLDAGLQHYTLSGSFSDPVATDAAYFVTPAAAVTMTSIGCTVIGGTSAVLTVYECTDVTCGTCTTEALSALTCDTSGETDTSLADGAWAASTCIKAVVGTVTGAVTNLIIYGTGTR